MYRKQKLQNIWKSSNKRLCKEFPAELKIQCREKQKIVGRSEKEDRKKKKKLI